MKMPTNTTVIIIYVDIDGLKFRFFFFTNLSKNKKAHFHLLSVCFQLDIFL